MDLDKIIKTMETCIGDRSCSSCPYGGEEQCVKAIFVDVITILKELREKGELSKASCASKDMIVSAADAKINKLQSEIDAQAQAIETLQAINARLEGKVEAYEYALRLAIG